MYFTLVFVLKPSVTTEPNRFKPDLRSTLRMLQPQMPKYIFNNYYYYTSNI